MIACQRSMTFVSNVSDIECPARKKACLIKLSTNMSNRSMSDKPFSEMKDEDWKQLRRRFMIRNTLVIAVIVTPLALFVLWLFFAPSTWGCLPTIIVAITIGALSFWLFLFVDANIRYRKRNREQALEKKSSAGKTVPSAVETLKAKASDEMVGKSFIKITYRTNNPAKDNN
jgi:hypothetical protein